MDIGNNWAKIRFLFNDALSSCAHCALATVNEDGSPHVTPIGGLFLREDQTGFYFDEYCNKSRQNIERDSRVCVLAVNSVPAFWDKSFTTGKFVSPPAVRLIGTAGEIREATGAEMGVWKNRISWARGTKGYEIAFSRMYRVRDITFDSFEPVEVGEMTLGLWL